MKQLDDLLSVWERHKEKGETISAEELCRESPELLEEVRWHIRALEEVESKFGNVETRFQNTTPGSSSQSASLLNQEFLITNRYQIQQHHASGGLGDVYVAVDPILNRKVAIKFPRNSRLTPEQFARFEREARITGQLDHPGIVAVHSLKISDDSQPCYVMRFVHGPTFQERAKEFHQSADAIQSGGRFSSAEFRELMQHFVTLCNIVGYAHDQGVIHRDIKPSNVILGPFGQTYLMDWGLARADRVDSHDSNPAAVLSAAELARSVEERFNRDSFKGNPSTKADFSTMTGQVMGTPAFASPEQLLGLTDQVDHRSDVYSLGASLYFVLTGKLPVEKSNLAEYYQRVSDVKESLLNFPTSIPTPLAAICRAATCVAPNLRYQTSLALAADLQRYLTGEPIAVLPETWLARSQRWLRKHPRTAVGSAVALGLVTLFAVVASALTTGFNRQLGEVNSDLLKSNTSLEQASNDADFARLRAETNFETARGAVDEFLVKVTDNARLKTDDFSDLQSELLESSRPFYEALLQQQPGDAKIEFARAEAYSRLARIDRRRSNGEAAKEGYQKALEILQPLLAEHHDPDEVRAAISTCQYEFGLLLQDNDDYAGAQTQFRAALTDCEPLVSTPKPLARHLQFAARTRTSLAALLANVFDKNEEAMAELTRAITIQQGLTGGGNVDPELRDDLAYGYQIRGRMYRSAGLLNEASQDFQAGLSLMKAQADEATRDPDFGLLLARLYMCSGDLKRLQGDLHSSLAEYASALSVQKSLADRFPSTLQFQLELGTGWIGLGNAQNTLGQLDKAIDSYSSAVELWRGLVSRNAEQSQFRAGLAGTLNNLGATFNQSGDRAKANEHFLEALSIQRKLLDELPDNTTRQLTLAETASNYGGFVLNDTPADAIPFLDEAEALFQEVLKTHPQHPMATQPRNHNLCYKAMALFDLARYEESTELFQTAVSQMDGTMRQQMEENTSLSRTFLELAPQLDSILAGNGEPSDDQERLELAQHCFRRRLFLRTASEFKIYLENVPECSAADLQLAAQAAALAAARKGDDAGELTETESAQWRSQCREWLERTLDKVAEVPINKDPPQVKATLTTLLSKRDLESVRDPDALAKLPVSERQIWENFWIKVRKLVQD